MKWYLLCLLLAGTRLLAQTPGSPFVAENWGLVLEDSGTKDVEVRRDIPYLTDEKGALHIDVYSPPGLKNNELRPTIVFMNGIGDSQGDKKMKSAGLYTSWPRLVAARGYVGITMESDGSRFFDCFDALFAYLRDTRGLHVDSERMGVYASSANVRATSNWLTSERAFPGIKSAVFYYGEVPKAPYRDDLPVFFVVAEGDVGGRQYSHLWSEVLGSRSPWTITLATDQIHVFDAFGDNEGSKRIIMQTLSFWRDHLEPVPASSSPPSPLRELIEAQYTGDYAKIVRTIRAWLKDNPGSKDPAPLRLLGNALTRQNEFAEAEGVYQESIRLGPGDRGTYLNMVVISYALDKLREGEKFLALYERDTTPEAFTYGYTGRILLSIKKYNSAETFLLKSIALGPHPSDYLSLARCLAVRGEKDAAFENLSKAVDNGFTNRHPYETSEELAPLRGDPRWEALLKRLK